MVLSLAKSIFNQHLRKTRTIAAKFRAARKAGCRTFVTEIVRSLDGQVLSAENWNFIAERCIENSMFLIADESLKAIRCVAPFACQRKGYSRYRPDMVFFGKGMKLSGAAIDWKGITMSRMGYDAYELRVDALLRWQMRFTRDASIADFIMGIAIIRTAKRE